MSDKQQPEPEHKTHGRIVARYEIPYFYCLNHRGEARTALPDSAREFGHLRKLYRMMMLTRLFDRRAVALQRTGQMGTYASCLGQEAIGTALGEAMTKDDVLLPSYRETPAMLMRGVGMHELLLYWGGNELGMCFENNRRDFPVCIPIATQAAHAVGVASAFMLKQQANVAVCVLGDGGSSKGDFYEALNIAGAWKLPVVFIVVNNHWAISVPRKAQSGAPTLAQKAIAAGIDCEQVDGNDLIILRERMANALNRARSGKPCLIEALTYRLGDHTTSDDASRYRSEEELSRHWKFEPIIRLQHYLEDCAEWDEQRQAECIKWCEEEVEASVNSYLSSPPPSPSSIFDHLYHTLPSSLYWQRQQAKDKGQGCG